METAGVVRSALDTSGFRVGERVSAFGVLGCYAERVTVPVPNVVRSPAELDDAQAVSLLVNYNTMYFALARRAAMRPGDTVLVLGAAGGVGTAAIQIAKAMGAGQVIAVTHRRLRRSAIRCRKPRQPCSAWPTVVCWASSSSSRRNQRGRARLIRQPALPPMLEAQNHLPV
jgi:NADPH:quinone reductase-like Zn-dependent oxidoreductase